MRGMVIGREPVAGASLAIAGDRASRLTVGVLLEAARPEPIPGSLGGTLPRIVDRVPRAAESRLPWVSSRWTATSASPNRSSNARRSPTANASKSKGRTSSSLHRLMKLTMFA